MPSSDNRIRLEYRDDIAFLTPARPDSANAIDLSLGREFLSSATAINTSPARAVVLAGEGANFCFGGDLKEMAAAGENLASHLKEPTASLHTGISYVMSSSIPIVAAVRDTAAGAGLGLVLSAARSPGGTPVSKADQHRQSRPK
jgi:2-(1,2-epoxy-1,2-dihydrophenyl)acetyl-CoA isomerase